MGKVIKVEFRRKKMIPVMPYDDPDTWMRDKDNNPYIYDKKDGIKRKERK